MSTTMSEREKRTQMMELGEVKKTLIILGIPSIIAMLISAIYNFVDTMFIGMLNDNLAMSAVSIAFPLFMIITAIGQMIGIGGASYTSRMLGNKKKELADKTVTISLILSGILAILTMVLGVAFLEPILGMMGASESVMPVAIEYSRWLLIGSIFTILNMSMNALVRAEGNAKYSMQALIIGAVLNIVLDPIFMFVFGWGIGGAALATVVGQACSTLYLLMYYVRKKSFVEINFKGISKNPLEDKEIYLEIFKIGIPVFLMQFLYSIACSLLNTAAMPYGETAIAAMGVCLRVYTIPLYIISGFIQGFQPFAAYNYGAQLYERLNQAIRFAFGLLLTVSVIFMGIFFVIPEVFIKLFTQDPEVVGIGVNALIAMCTLIPMVTILLIITAVFQSMGKANQSAILSVSRQGILLIPMALILPNVFETFGGELQWIMNLLPNSMPDGLYGVILAQPIADFLTTILSIILGIKVFKELKVLEKAQSNKEAKNQVGQKVA